MNHLIIHIAQKQFLNKWMWRILAVLLFGVILMPHHHHAHEELCVKMDWAHHHAETHPSAGECDNCCVTRFVSYRQQKVEHAKVKPVFLLSLLLSSFIFGLRRSHVSGMKRTWIVRDGAFVPDDYNATPYGWRAPPFIY